MKTAHEIIEELKADKCHSRVFRGVGGHKQLTISYQPSKDSFRFFCGSRPGGGGRKYQRCSEIRAKQLIAATLPHCSVIETGQTAKER